MTYTHETAAITLLLNMILVAYTEFKNFPHSCNRQAHHFFL
jgi:hypothetical protein